MGLSDADAGPQFGTRLPLDCSLEPGRMCFGASAKRGRSAAAASVPKKNGLQNDTTPGLMGASKKAVAASAAAHQNTLKRTID